jgi:hypothetical protein
MLSSVVAYILDVGIGTAIHQVCNQPLVALFVCMMQCGIVRPLEIAAVDIEIIMKCEQLQHIRGVALLTCLHHVQYPTSQVICHTHTKRERERDRETERGKVDCESI